MVQKTNIYSIVVKNQGEVFLFQQSNGYPLMDISKDVMIRLIGAIYAKIAKVPGGLKVMKDNGFELKLVLLNLDYDDGRGVEIQSFHEWLDGVRNIEAVPESLRGMINEAGSKATIINTPVGKLIVTPLREELVILDYAEEEATAAVRKSAFASVIN